MQIFFFSFVCLGFFVLVFLVCFCKTKGIGHFLGGEVWLEHQWRLTVLDWRPNRCWCWWRWQDTSSGLAANQQWRYVPLELSMGSDLGGVGPSGMWTSLQLTGAPAAQAPKAQVPLAEAAQDPQFARGCTVCSTWGCTGVTFSQDDCRACSPFRGLEQADAGLCGGRHRNTVNSV